MAYWVLKIIMTPVLRVIFRVRSEGTDNVPRKGPVILASNHQSFIDSVFLPLVVRRRVTFVAKAEYFESRKTAWFFRAVGMIPLKRGGGPASARALAAAREVLESGGVLGIYPEGTRSPDGRLYKGHTGVARLSMQCGAPVVPVAQFGTARCSPSGPCGPSCSAGSRSRWGRRCGGRARRGDPSDLRQFTDQIMAAIAALSGQEMVDQYAKRDRGRLSAPGLRSRPVPADGPRPGPRRRPRRVGRRRDRSRRNAAGGNNRFTRGRYRRAVPSFILRVWVPDRPGALARWPAGSAPSRRPGRHRHPRAGRRPGHRRARGRAARRVAWWTC